MDFSKSKVLLKKINTLHEGADAFNQEFSSLERDLFLQYLRELYECVSKTRGKSEEVIQKSTPASNPKSKEPKYERPKQEYVAKKIEEVEAVNPVISNGSKPSIQHSHHVSTAEESRGEVTTEWEPELIELFETTSSPEPANRFANAAVADISKGLGINERILTINELFDGNQQLYQQVIDHLNSLSSFDEAVNYLAKGIAKDKKWGHKKRKKKAEVFLNLVKRRYL